MGGLWRLRVSRQSVDSRQLRIEDCLPGDRLEAESRTGVLSDAMATQTRKDNEQANGRNLLEEILELGNMVQA